jgi:hypothetical protein
MLVRELCRTKAWNTDNVKPLSTTVDAVDSEKFAVAVDRFDGAVSGAQKTRRTVGIAIAQ